MMEYPYANGYIYIPVHIPAERLPETVSISGTMLHRKSSFHVSLVCVKCIAARYAEFGRESDEALAHEVIGFFKKYAHAHPLLFSGFRNEIRHAQTEEKESIVICCDIKNLSGFFDILNAELKSSIPYQPTHVTLYTREPDIAIGISSPEQMASYELVHLPEMSSVLLHT